MLKNIRRYRGRKLYVMMIIGKSCKFEYLGGKKWVDNYKKKTLQKIRQATINEHDAFAFKIIVIIIFGVGGLRGLADIRKII